MNDLTNKGFLSQQPFGNYNFGEMSIIFVLFTVMVGMILVAFAIVMHLLFAPPDSLVIGVFGFSWVGFIA